jgi:transposase
MMILDVSSIDHIYIVGGATDFRKGILSLASIVRDTYNLDPFSDSIFIFSNKRRKSIKILHYDVNGFELYTKTVTDDSKYQWPKDDEEALLITSRQLEWLLDGLSIDQKMAFKSSSPGYF